MKFTKGVCTGIRHTKSGISCQDVADFLVRRDGKAAFAVSDGCSSSRYAEDAAALNVKIALDLLTTDWAWNPKVKEEDFRRELVKRFDKEFGVLSRRMKTNLDEFSATLSAVSIYKNDDDVEFICISVGDGHIIGITDDFKPFSLCYPYNCGSKPRSTMFTIKGEECRKEMHVLLGCFNRYSIPEKEGKRLAGFVVCTDGADKFLMRWPASGADYLRKLAAETVCGIDNGQALAELIVQSDYCDDDDVSFVCYMQDTPELQAKARAFLNGQNIRQMPDEKIDDIPEESPRDSEYLKEEAPEELSAPAVEETPLQFPDELPYYQPVLNALSRRNMSGEELEKEGFCLLFPRERFAMKTVFIS